MRSSLFGLDRLRITGSRWTSNGRSSRIVSLIWLPRPANESPKPISVFWASERVRGANVDSTSSSSGAAATALRSGTVAPVSNVRRERPGISSTYLRPSAERGRTPTRVSTESGSMSLSSFSSSRATDRSRPSTVRRTAVMSSTTPTRKPPARTSLPGTSLAPLGSPR